MEVWQMLVSGFLFLILTLLADENNPIVEKQENDCNKNCLCNNELVFWHFVSLLPEPLRVFFIRSFQNYSEGFLRRITGTEIRNFIKSQLCY